MSPMGLRNCIYSRSHSIRKTMAVTIGGVGAEGEFARLRVEGEKLEIELAGAGETLAGRSAHQALGGDGQQRAGGDGAGIRGAARWQGIYEQDAVESNQEREKVKKK